MPAKEKRPHFVSRNLYSAISV